MLPPEAFADWVALKLWILYYNMQLTKEEKAENKAALVEWEFERDQSEAIRKAERNRTRADD